MINNCRIENGTKIRFDIISEFDLSESLCRLLDEDIETVDSFTGSRYGYTENLPSIYNCDSDLHYDDWEYTRDVPEETIIFSREHFYIPDSISLEGKSRFFKSEVCIHAYGEEENDPHGEIVIGYYSVIISAAAGSEDSLKEYAEKYF